LAFWPTKPNLLTLGLQTAAVWCHICVLMLAEDDNNDEAPLGIILLLAGH